MATRGRQREITMRFLAEPMDVNFGGKVHGGAVMKWIDQAGYACAVGWSGLYCVTLYVGEVTISQILRRLLPCSPDLYLGFPFFHRWKISSSSYTTMGLLSS